MDTYLAHYGILGMKWGVRRYQNYDGSYTQRGLKRYKTAESEYEAAKSQYKSNKTRSAASNVRRAKANLKKSYRDLKKDKLADEGKDLYGRGKTITSLTNTSSITAAAIAAGATVANRVVSNYADKPVTDIVTNTIAYGGTALNIGKYYHDTKRLRAYYAHG